MPKKALSPVVWFFAALLGAALVWSPERAAVWFPLAGVVLVAAAATLGAGSAGLAAFALTVVSLLIAKRWPADQRLTFFVAVPQLWALCFLLKHLEDLSAAWNHERDTARADLEKRVAESKKEINFLQKSIAAIKTRSARRQHLAACAKNIGAAFDASQIQSQLLSWTEKTFPGEHCLLTGLLDNDPLDSWVIQRRQALLCEDVSADPRFKLSRVEPGTKSLMVAPLFVDSKVFGALRVESAAPGRFSNEDLRDLDALSTMASLALDNGILYHRIEELAVRDGLTQLLTHRAFEERMTDEVLRAGRYHYSVSLLMVDVDHFKKVNDNYGHAAGDDVLRRVSALLAASARPVDVPARYGGEEFSLLLIDMPNAGALQVAEKLRQALAAETFSAGGRTFQVTMSVGVAAFPEEALTPPQLVRTADQRLYAAKSGGRNRVVGHA